MRDWDKIERNKSKEVSNRFLLGLACISGAFIVGLVWGISIGMDWAEQGLR